MRGQGQVRPPRRGGLSLAPFALFLALLCLGGCGGSSGDSAQTTTATAASKATVAQAPKPKPAPEGNKASAAKWTSPTPAPGAPGDPSPGEKAPAPSVPLTPQGDNSIQSFGTEGEEDERAQAYANLRSYLAALGAGEFAQACALGSNQLRGELEKLIEAAKVPEGQQRPQGCSQTLGALLGGGSGKALGPITAVGELLSFRARGKYAYLIYRGEGGKAMFIAMANDEGEWKVNVPRPEPFQSANPSQGGSEQ